MRLLFITMGFVGLVIVGYFVAFLARSFAPERLRDSFEHSQGSKAMKEE